MAIEYNSQHPKDGYEQRVNTTPLKGILQDAGISLSRYMGCMEA
mgnify:CR=1 FL=1